MPDLDVLCYISMGPIKLCETIYKDVTFSLHVTLCMYVGSFLKLRTLIIIHGLHGTAVSDIVFRDIYFV